MMEMQEDWEPTGWVDDIAILLLEKENSMLVSGSSNSLPPEPYAIGEEISSRDSLKISTYCQRWDLATPGVYVPSSTRFNFHYDGESMELQTFGHFNHPPGLKKEKEEEEDFIILVETCDSGNQPPQKGKTFLYHCKKCKKSFQDLSRLEEHMQLHVVGKTYGCSLCGKEFFRSANLRMHKLTHSAEKPHKCPLCKKGFIRPADVRRHLRCFHKMDHSSIILRNASVMNHWSGAQQNQGDREKPGQLVSAAKKPEEEVSKWYFCPICNKGFSTSSLLSKHKVIHREEKPYRCKECGKAFVQLIRLKRHCQTHTGERPFSCEDCGKTFTRLGSVKRHQRIHTGEKPYICSHCSLSFSELGTLKRHEKIHVIIQA
ncbi:zinc finger protein 98 [Anolis carolinensis]|uniref:C2H2-type domain-containing protein n=1 Tax=Anolis carolinensis TaxID=28377 RepID=A0A803TNI7_ANOCA